MSERDDMVLLEQLTAALQAEPVAPSASEVAALRAMVVEGSAHRDAAVVPFPSAGRRRIRRALVGVALAAALAVGGSSAAFAAGAPLPRVVRQTVYSLGLPIESPDYHDAKDALDGLRRSLRGPSDAQVAAARRAVISSLARLSGDERHDLSDDARPLLREADERLSGEDGGAASGRGGNRDGDGGANASSSQHEGGGTEGGGGSTGRDEGGTSGSGASSGTSSGGASGGSGGSGSSDGGSVSSPTTSPSSGSGSDGGGSGSGGSGSDGSSLDGMSTDGGSGTSGPS